MTKFIKYTLRAVGILFGILLLLYIIAFIYVSVNKKSIIKEVTSEIGKKINGHVSIGDVELSFFRSFPRAAVLLHKVLVTDTMFALHHQAFFQADEVYVQLSIFKLIKKESAVNGIRIERASVYLFTDTSGYTNAYLLKAKSNSVPAAGKTTDEDNQLKSVELEKVHITLDDKLKEKLYDGVFNHLAVKIKEEEGATHFFVKANILVNNLAFNLPNGSFIKGKKFEGDFDARLDKKLQQLQFDSIHIKLSGQPFNMTGRFDLVKPDPQFSLRVHTRQILYAFAKTLLPARIDTALSIVNIDKKIDADADINGPLNGGDPLLIAKWKVHNAHLKTPFLDFDNTSFTGYYTNEVVAGKPRRDPNSRINISNFSAKWNRLPVASGNIDILNLYKPLLTCDLTANFPLKLLNDIIGSNAIQLQSGDGSIEVTYKGPIEKNNNTNSLVNGVVSFKNGNVLYTPRNVELKNVNGRLVIKNSDVLIENLQCNVFNNKIIMDGEAKNLITLINTEPNKVNIDWNIYSPSLDLTSFTYLLKPGRKFSENSSQTNKINKASTSIDNALDQGSLHVNLRAAKLSYKKFEATDVRANVSLLQDSYVINNVSMNQGGGHINLSGSLVLQKENYHQAKVKVSMDNVDVNKVFTAFGNFGQDGIQAQNLEGKLTAKVDANFSLDDDGKANPRTLVSTVDFSLKNGALNNFEPLKKLQSFVFKNRDFDNIRFAELKDRLDIANQEIRINRMEIESSVLSIFVEGIYSMKGTTDMSIQVPLSNLKKRGADYVPENIGTDKKIGTSIFIRGRPGADGTIQFKPDLFNKYKKDKDKNDAQ
ncbi:MAG: AsmA-like C-terminal region-containing protein [Ginsengibacter sp.]